MLIGIDKNEKKEYVSQYDTAEVKTVFLLGNISNRQKMSMLTSVIDSDGKVNPSKLQERAFDIVQVGLKGIKNFFDPAEKRAVDIDVVTEGVIDILPVQVLYELAGKIAEYNFSEESIVKN